jgi:hypothetical protein
VIKDQTRVDVLARTLADAVAFVAPPGPFEVKDEELGVRVFRTTDDSRIWIVALLRDRRLTCRVEGEGGVAIWRE